MQEAPEVAAEADVPAHVLALAPVAAAPAAARKIHLKRYPIMSINKERMTWEDGHERNGSNLQ